MNKVVFIDDNVMCNLLVIALLIKLPNKLKFLYTNYQHYSSFYDFTIN